MAGRTRPVGLWLDAGRQVTPLRASRCHELM